MQRTLNDAGSVFNQSAFNAVACTRRDKDTLVASSYAIVVSLQRLASLPLRLERIATSVITGLTGAKWFLFRRELLLIFDWNGAPNKAAIVSLGDGQRAP